MVWLHFVIIFHDKSQFWFLSHNNISLQVNASIQSYILRNLWIQIMIWSMLNVPINASFIWTLYFTFHFYLWYYVFSIYWKFIIYSYGSKKWISKESRRLLYLGLLWRSNKIFYNSMELDLSHYSNNFRWTLLSFTT